MLEETQWTNKRILMLLALGTLIVSVIWHAPDEAHYLGERLGELFLTLVLAMGLTYLLRPCVNALHRTRAFGAGSHKGRVWATVMTFIGCGVLLWIFVLIGLKPVVNDTRELWNSFIPSNPIERAAMISNWKASLQTALEPYRDILPFNMQEIEKSVKDGILPAARYVGGKLSHSVSPGFIVELILIPVLVFYFLTDGPAIRQEARLLMPAKWRPRAADMAQHFDRVLDGYTRGQVLMCIIAWVLVTAGLWILRVPHAFTLGLIAGLTRAVPVIGPLLGAVPLVLVCLVTTKQMDTTIAVLLGFTAMHFIESKILLPRIVGHEVDLHPVSVIVALLLGLEFFGFIGVFLAVPIAAVLKIVLTEWHDARLRELQAREA